MAHPISLDERVTAEIRAEMAFQRKTIADLAELLGVSRQAAKKRYDGEQTFSLNEVEEVATWLEVDRSQLVLGLHNAERVPA